MDRELLIVTRAAGLASTWGGAHVVSTMLDMIAWLERAGSAAVTLILRGEYATDEATARFVRDTYPSVDVVASQPRTSVVDEFPALAMEA
jgi:hypothetical protein